MWPTLYYNHYVLSFTPCVIIWYFFHWCHIDIYTQDDIYTECQESFYYRTRSLSWNYLLYGIILQPAQCLHSTGKNTAPCGKPYQHGFTLITESISSDFNYKIWDKITYPFQILYGYTIEILNGLVISSHPLLGMWLFMHAVIIVKWCEH